MTLVRDIKKAEKLHQLLLDGNTGSPKQLANQLQIDRTTLYMMIDALNALNMKLFITK